MGSIRIRVAALIRRGDEVLLIQQTKGGRDYWLLPGGGVEFGERFAQALKREMREETNLEVQVKDLAFTSESINPSGERHIVHVVFWTDIVGGDMCVGREEGLKSLEFIPIAKLAELDLRPPIAGELQRILGNGVGGATHLEAEWRD